MKKRIISLLMALLMLTSLLPTAVWAEGDTPEQAAAAATDSGTVEQEQEQEPAATPETPETPEAPEAPVEPEQPTEPDSNGIALCSAASGSCGKKVTYTLSDDGVLTILGTGAMTNFTYTDNDESNRPWHSERESIRKVVIEEGVTSIGNFAFSFCNVQEVTIPSTVTSIGKRAFMGTPLSSVVIPEGVKTIGENAFWRCTSLQTVTVPASTTELGNHAFDTGEYYDGSYHTQLTDIYYGGSRQQWYNAGGGDAAPMVVTIHYNGATGNIIDSGTCGDNAFWKLDKDYTLTISGTGAMWDYPTSEDDSWWMDWALPWKSYEAISRIVVAEGITHIGAYAFYCTDNATALSLPDSLTSIGQDAFCSFGGTEIIVPDKVTSIGDFAFNGCENLQTITLPAGLQSIGFCFIECDTLETINFKGTMEQWLVCGGGESTFPVTAKVTCAKGGTLREGGKCGDNLTWTLDSSGKLTISGTGDMENYASESSRGTDPAPWSYASSMIRSVEIDSGVTRIGSYAFENTNITSLTIPGSVTAIGDYGVNVNRYLAELTLNEGLRSIGKGAFSGNKRLTTVTIPDGVTTIGEEAFAHCWTQLPKSDSFTGLTTVTIPGSVTSIGKNAFTNNQQLTTVNFDGTQEQWNAAGGKNAGVPSTATFHCVKVVANGKCGTGVKWSLASNGVLTITGTGKGIMTDYQPGNAPWAVKTVTQVVIGEGVTHVGNYAFAEMDITRVTLPESLTSIGHHAFSFSAITAVTIPGSVTSIDPEAFWGCSDLTSLTICDGVTAIDSAAFGECTALTKLVLPDSVTTIGAQAFDGCTGLEEITFSRNLTSIGYMAFSGCTGLTELVFPDSLKEIGQESFKYCSGLRAVSLGTGLTTIGRMAFDGCNPTAVDYRGTQKEWRSIAIGNKNDCLSRVTCIKLGVIVTDGDTPDVKDVASLYDHLTGQADTAYTPQQELSADVNRDGTLDVYDLQRLYEAVAQGTKL